jgi:cysteine desulfurase family protein (TIGR01976 family)
MQIQKSTFLQARQHFPALARNTKGNPVIFLDGPAGTQVPAQVIEAISHYYKTSNSNTHGFFRNTRETDQIIHEAREWSAKFFGAEGPETISFGQNMTTLAYFLSAGFGRILKPGDEIIITQLDHEANRGPWLVLKESGITIVEVNITAQGILDMDDFQKKLSERTKLVAVGCASNALGTVNDVKTIREMSKRVGAKLLLDAVHFAPHFPINVMELDCEFLLASAYKFYGPHVGILYSKPGELDILPVDSLRTQDQIPPCKIETGTLNHAAIAGVTACIKFIMEMAGEDTPQKAMKLLAVHERILLEKLFHGLSEVPSVKIQGPGLDYPRTPTVSFTHDKYRPEVVCEKLGEMGIFAWDGHFFAIRPIEALGLLERGGVTRLGISMYTTEDEIEKTIQAMLQLH